LSAVRGSGLFATKTLSGNLARLPDKVLDDQSRIGTALSRVAPKRSGGPAKPVDDDGAMWPLECATFISQAIIRISYHCERSNPAIATFC
jgi:hypothetical protein